MLPMTIYGNVLVNNECTTESSHKLATFKSHVALTITTEGMEVIYSVLKCYMATNDSSSLYCHQRSGTRVMDRIILSHTGLERTRESLHLKF